MWATSSSKRVRKFRLRDVHRSRSKFLQTFAQNVLLVVPVMHNHQIFPGQGLIVVNINNLIALLILLLLLY